MKIEKLCAVEQAALTVRPGTQPDFEVAVEKGIDILARADGFRWAHLLHGHEAPDTYVLLVGWDSVEHHTVGFAGSELFVEWRAQIAPFLAGAPTVAHYTPT
ncbi:antibiotic biosynthesis monooxygenase [Rhodococcus opacus]|uniref:Antibiotic biosynthesis monooxygenase n=1 Tax=Rhodococcus opacus TaxID=37919 RepID=A0AAX3YTL5_RHOOP|nr:antibiotic biosynthesis monooxygenase [Rhodococcus opacus]MCZ4585961.1 antibiotic biosynthesis monooxygenase [Rhodococcus opacus]WLF52083.1 antibiotic biosynthesis monooxygenase [Rhodococcus opacus]